MRDGNADPPKPSVGELEEHTEPGGRPPLADVPSSGDPMIGRVLDNRYRVVKLLARGGMGRVYRAEQAPLGRAVALKVVECNDANLDPEFRARFMREAAACARLSHPNTIRIFDYGQTWDGVVFLAMELLEGETLHQLIRTRAPLPPERVIQLGRQICASLGEAHRLGMVHRDLKPSNVMIIDDGEGGDFVKVLDFGLVKDLGGEDDRLTRADAVVGSPSYMSPEQIRSGVVDQRSDIYSVGILLFAALTGRTPFAGVSSVNVLMAHLSTPVPLMREVAPGVTVPPDLEAVVRRCLAKDPADRFPDVDELSRALRACRVAMDASASLEPTPAPQARIEGSEPASRPDSPTLAPRAPAPEVSITSTPRPRAVSPTRWVLGAAAVFFVGSIGAAALLGWVFDASVGPPSASPARTELAAPAAEPVPTPAAEPVPTPAAEPVSVSAAAPVPLKAANTPPRGVPPPTAAPARPPRTPSAPASATATAAAPVLVATTPTYPASAPDSGNEASPAPSPEPVASAPSASDPGPAASTTRAPDAGFSPSSPPSDLRDPWKDEP